MLYKKICIYISIQIIFLNEIDKKKNQITIMKRKIKTLTSKKKKHS